MSRAADNLAVAALAATLAYNFVCAKDSRPGNTISERTRAIFHVHTPVGRIAFTAAFGLGAALLHGHIVNGGDQ